MTRMRMCLGASVGLRASLLDQIMRMLSSDRIGLIILTTDLMQMACWKDDLEPYLWLYAGPPVLDHCFT